VGATRLQFPKVHHRGMPYPARSICDGRHPTGDPPPAWSHTLDRARSIDDLPAAGRRAVSPTGAAVCACRGLAAGRRWSLDCRTTAGVAL